ncbi:hypothetical protein EG347_14715 [Chryseobacterium sp. G0186]|uniref:hypothetical protein n=1 Tax=Chryseobacterium sp. G0186 TaxID=2487064 RepID=UPI000F4D61F3|nr:hypothetical protein [Chryseobacterium sp. G0186]AZA78671.1 hypothetical protein EG347_14715 [Chryseobacterium sp. G0186]
MHAKIRIIKKELAEDNLSVLFDIGIIEKTMPAEFSLEEPGLSIENYNALLQKGEETLEILYYKNEIERIKEEISIEITESAYEGDFRTEEYANLVKDLFVSGFHFFEEDIIIVFMAPEIFSNNTINVQLDYLLEIQDLSIEWWS